MDGNETRKCELAELVDHVLQRPPARQALEYEGRWFGWGDLRRMADEVRACLRRSGAPPHQPVAFVAKNRPAAVAALLGLIAESRTIQMVYAFQSGAALTKVIDGLSPALVVAVGDTFDDAMKTFLGERGIAAIRLDEDSASLVDGLERSTVTGPAPASDEPEIHILTSGTTGAPKQHPFPYQMFYQHHVLPTAPSGFDNDRTDEPPFLLTFPLGNITGMFTTLPTLLSGRRAILADRFTLEIWRDWVKRFKPLNAGLPPAGIRMILDQNIPVEELASVRCVGTGAAPLDPDLQRRFEARYGIPILLSYGATEFGGPVTAMTAADHAEWGSRKLGSVGRALQGVALRIVAPDTGEVRPAGEQGLLEVRPQRFDSDWLRTSDLGMIDTDGFLFLAGRADGAIMRGGFKLLPGVIEQALQLSPYVAEAVVVGVSDQRLGQAPVAAIRLRPGCAWPGDAVLAAHVREHLPATHLPVAWLRVEEMPLSRSMKVDRVAVRELFESGKPA